MKERGIKDKLPLVITRVCGRHSSSRLEYDELRPLKVLSGLPGTH